MSRTKILDTAILTVLLIGVSTFPVGLLVKDTFWYYVIEALLMLAVFIFILFYEKRHPEINPPYKRFSLFNLLFLSPALIVCASNFLYALFTRLSPSEFTFPMYCIPQIAFIFLNVIVEEYVFRKHLLGNLTHPNKLIRILISAGIFAACHLTLFFSTFDPFTLISVVYTFALGMVLGLIYCYGHSLIACIGFHFLFNFFNDFLFGRFYPLVDVLWFILINVFISLAVAIYLGLIYFFKLRKNPAELDLN